MEEFSPLSDILAARRRKGIETKRHIPRNRIHRDLSIKDETDMLPIHSILVWDGATRNDEIVYLAINGMLVLWRGSCCSVDGIEKYNDLRLTHLTDEELGRFIKTHDDFFERVIEELRTRYLDSIRAREIQMQYLRDGFRLISETQRRLGFYPQDK